jgi:hypothetical protein
MGLALMLGAWQTVAEDGPWNVLLPKAGLSVEDVQIPTANRYGMGKYPRKVFKSVWEDWTKLDATALRAGNTFMKASGSCTALIAAAASYNDATASIKSPTPAKDGNGQDLLLTAIEKIHAYGKAPLTDSQGNELRAAIATIPADIAGTAAGILDAVPSACDFRNKSLQEAAGSDEFAALFDHAVRLTNNSRTPPPIRKLLKAGDMASLTNGALTLAQTLDAAAAAKPAGANAEFSFVHKTPLGTIALNGRQADIYEQDNYLLIVDAGGDDLYHDGATNNNAQTPISLLIDYAGNDRYEAEGIGFGTGILGYGMLVDCGGKDTYQTQGGLGYCAWGVGLLLDLGADDDAYKIKSHGLACGSMGIALVNDMGGNDSYYCRWLGQGLAKVASCAALVDVAGNDAYEADDTNIDHASPQTKKHNTSLAMGCGFGRRAHPGDGYSLAGGVGMLIDGSGDDTYVSGVFGQGVGYWYALGMLIDFEGNDQHTGVWYSQGASAHYAVAAMLDLAGDDHYRLTMNQGQGHGRDFSTGLLHDVGGSDILEGPGSAVGNGNMNGVGLFWKQNGKTDFRCPGKAPGSAAPARPQHMCLGLFMAENGVFQFREDSQASPDAFWVRPPTKKNPKSHGIGMATPQKILAD